VGRLARDDVQHVGLDGAQELGRIPKTAGIPSWAASSSALATVRLATATTSTPGTSRQAAIWKRAQKPVPTRATRSGDVGARGVMYEAYASAPLAVNMPENGRT
jgi:hypothetical protein